MPSLHNQAVSLYSSQDTCPCFHCLCISFLPFSLTSKYWLSHAGLLPSLPLFLHLGIKSSCTLWRASLNICQLCSAFLSLRAVSQGAILTNSLKSWNFAFPKFRILNLLFTWPFSLGTVNSTSTWSLQPRLPPCLTSLISSLALVTVRSSMASSLVGLLSSIHSRSLLDCLQLMVLLLQQISGWLKSLSRTRAC